MWCATKEMICTAVGALDKGVYAVRDQRDDMYSCRCTRQGGVCGARASSGSNHLGGLFSSALPSDTDGPNITSDHAHLQALPRVSARVRAHPGVYERVWAFLSVSERF